MEWETTHSACGLRSVGVPYLHPTSVLQHTGQPLKAEILSELLITLGFDDSWVPSGRNRAVKTWRVNWTLHLLAVGPQRASLTFLSLLPHLWNGQKTQFPRLWWKLRYFTQNIQCTKSAWKMGVNSINISCSYTPKLQLLSLVWTEDQIWSEQEFWNFHPFAKCT